LRDLRAGTRLIARFASTRIAATRVACALIRNSTSGLHELVAKEPNRNRKFIHSNKKQGRERKEADGR
jgi:hypothetical protein